MKAYVLAHLRKAPAHPEVAEYIERIQGVLDQFEGRFLIHGGTVDVREGEWPGDVVLVEFPNMERARAFYDSDVYDEIKHLRTNNLAGDLIVVEGVEPGHDSSAMGADMRRAIGLSRSRRRRGRLGPDADGLLVLRQMLRAAEELDE